MFNTFKKNVTKKRNSLANKFKRIKFDKYALEKIAKLANETPSKEEKNYQKQLNQGSSDSDSSGSES